MHLPSSQLQHVAFCVARQPWHHALLMRCGTGNTVHCFLKEYYSYPQRENTKQGSQLALCRAEIAHLISSLFFCLFETFRWDLKWDVLFETFWNFWNFSNLSWRVAYLKLSDETWNEMCYLKLLKLETFQPITGVAYLKCLDETWNEMCYLKRLKLETLKSPLRPKSFNYP